VRGRVRYAGQAPMTIDLLATARRRRTIQTTEGEQPMSKPVQEAPTHEETIRLQLARLEEQRREMEALLNQEAENAKRRELAKAEAERFVQALPARLREEWEPLAKREKDQRRKATDAARALMATCRELHETQVELERRWRRIDDDLSKHGLAGHPLRPQRLKPATCDGEMHFVTGYFLDRLDLFVQHSK